MPNLKDIRNRITSVSSTMQITSAMKLVSAAKLRKAQDAITDLKPYSEKMQELLQNLAASLDGSVGGEYTKQHNTNKVLLIPVTSNKGLAGAFNSSIIKKTQELMQNELKGKEFHIYALGKKAFDAFKRSPIFWKNSNDAVEKPNSEKVNPITDVIISEFLKGNYDAVYVIYNSFRNAAIQEVLVEKVLPISIDSSDVSTKVDYIYEPNKASIVVDLIPKTLKSQMLKAVLDSQASEHGARMTAMHKATDNADALRKDLTIEYNKARQASITKEILEIVGGAEALVG